MSREDKMQLDEGGAGRVAGRVFAFVGVTLACAVIAVLAAVFIITKGPSPAAREVFVQRASDSGLSFLAGLFVPEDEIEAIRPCRARSPWRAPRQPRATRRLRAPSL